MQTSKQSFIEAVVNVGTGMLIAFTTTQTLAPVLDITITASSNIILTCLLTCVSIVRSYLWRRYFTRRNSK